MNEEEPSTSRLTQIRRITTKRTPVWLTAILAVAALLAGVAIGDDQTAIDTLEADLAAAHDDNNALQDDLDDTETDLGDMETERDELTEEIDGLKDDVRTLRKEHSDVTKERDELLVRYDPQIQEAINSLQQNASDAACHAADQAGYAGDAKPDADTFVDEAVTNAPPSISPEEARKRIDVGAISARIDACFAEAERRANADRLFQPFGDGIYTVGVEIAAGRWRSNGTGSSCYWKIAPDGRPDDITDNHLGPAGGTVIVGAGQEFHTERCGQWEYVG